MDWSIVVWRQLFSFVQAGHFLFRGCGSRLVLRSPGLCWSWSWPPTAVQNSRKSDMRPRVLVQVNQLCFFKFFAESLNFAILTHVSNPSLLPRHVAHTPLRTPSPGAAGARENADNSIARTIFFLRFVFLLEPFPVLSVCLF